MRSARMYISHFIQVLNLNEMGDIHTCVLHDVTVLLIGVDGGGVVVFRLHHHVLKRHQKTLRFTLHFIGQNLLHVVSTLRTLDRVLQGV